MANIEYTPNLDLAKQPTGAKEWGMVLNENFEKIDEEVTTLDAQNVKLTGTQTVAGEKTFTSNIVRRGAFNTSGLNITKATDTNGKGEANNIAYYAGNGIYNRLLATNKTANKNAYLDILARDDGTGIIQSGGSAPITVNFSNAAAVNVPTPAASDNSIKAATTAWVNTRLGGTGITSTEIGYLDGVTSNIQTQLNGTVKTSGNQEWTGVKTAKHANIQVKCSVADDAATSLSSSEERGLLILDKNGSRIGNFYSGQLTSGRLRTYMCSARSVSGTMKYQYAEILQNTDGTGNFNISCTSATAPTPGASDNSTKIATTAWVNSRITSSMSNNDYVVESGTNYMLFKSKKLICWVKDQAKGTWTFPKTFADTNYIVISRHPVASTNTTTNLTISDMYQGIDWKATKTDILVIGTGA